MYGLIYDPSWLGQKMLAIQDCVGLLDLTGSMLADPDVYTPEQKRLRPRPCLSLQR